MTTPAHDDPAPNPVRALFDAQVESLDPATVTALRVRRREALAARAARRPASWWWPVGGLATAALALAIALPRGATDEGGPDVGTAAPTAVAAATTSADLDAAEPIDAASAARFAESAMAELENDAAFYAWLATQPADAAPSDPSTPTSHEG